MKKITFVLAAFMIAMAGPATASHEGDFPALRGRVGYVGGESLWNPFEGTAPWRMPVSIHSYRDAHCPPVTTYVPSGRTIIRERVVRPFRTSWRRTCVNETSLGGTPAGIPSYQYHDYNP
jgi:hypothetical protein